MGEFNDGTVLFFAKISECPKPVLIFLGHFWILSVPIEIEF